MEIIYNTLKALRDGANPMGKLEQMYYAEKGKYILNDEEQTAFDYLFEEFLSCEDKFLFFDDSAPNRIFCLTADEIEEQYANDAYEYPDSSIEDYWDFCIYSSMHVLRMFKNMELDDIIKAFRQKGIKDI